MKNVVVGLSLFVAALMASESPAASRITCAQGEFTVSVDIDVLESNPPQSQITVRKFGNDWGSYSGFTEYLELESFPVQYQWRFADHDNKRLLIVTTKAPAGRGPRAAKGTYRYNRATSPLLLNCTVR